MRFAKLDNIVRGVLLQKGYPIHWYMQGLVHARDCLRELAMDDLRVIDTQLLDVDDNHEVALPCSYIDYVRVAVRVGEYLKPLVESDLLNPLANYNSAGTQIPYDNTTSDDVSNTLYYELTAGFYWRTVTWNQFGENIGRLFGFRNGSPVDTFRVIPERDVIKVNEHLGVDKIVLMFISDGMECSAATQVDAYAQRTIETYILWQFKEMNRNYGVGERQLAEREYLKQRTILRARKADWTIEKIKRIFQHNFYQAPKS